MAPRASEHRRRQGSCGDFLSHLLADEKRHKDDHKTKDAEANSPADLAAKPPVPRFRVGQLVRHADLLVLQLIKHELISEPVLVVPWVRLMRAGELWCQTACTRNTIIITQDRGKRVSCSDD